MRSFYHDATVKEKGNEIYYLRYEGDIKSQTES